MALGAYLFFGYVCTPAIARGESMEPTYADGSLLFCWRPRYWFRAPRRGDVVMVRLAGGRVMYLKRIVAVAGDSVSFCKGRLHLDGEPVEEPYVKTSCDWELVTRVVPAGQVYVVGDNRGMPMEQHKFGRTSVKRLVGGAIP